MQGTGGGANAGILIGIAGRFSDVQRERPERPTDRGVHVLASSCPRYARRVSARHIICRYVHF